MPVDHSEGWDDVAEQFMEARSNIGAHLVLSWARDILPQSGSVIDIGCGSGMPITQTLIGQGFEVLGIDASPKLITAFQHRFPNVRSACEAAQNSTFFHRTFDAAIAIGLLFLLTEHDQGKVIHRVANSLKPGGRFLFSAPREKCEWKDILTGRRSQSLGVDGYELLLQASGLNLMGCRVDEGDNNYYDAIKVPIE